MANPPHNSSCRQNYSQNPHQLSNKNCYSTNQFTRSCWLTRLTTKHQSINHILNLKRSSLIKIANVYEQKRLISNNLNEKKLSSPIMKNITTIIRRSCNQLLFPRNQQLNQLTQRLAQYLKKESLKIIQNIKINLTHQQ